MHLSLHGQADYIDPLGAEIWFGSGGRDPMYGFEIAYSPGHADLVIVSACETADGAHATGEGVYSMARSFFQAGAGSVMATIWKVENCHNAHIELETWNQKYAELMQGLDKAEALWLSAQEALEGAG